MRATLPLARVVIIGPRLDARGGIAMVNATYAAAGLFEDANQTPLITYFPSTRDASYPKKCAYAALRLAIFAFTPLPRPSLVHLHTTSHSSFWRKAAYACVARAKGARVIHHIHASSFIEFYERGGRLRRAAVRATLGRADALIALTEGMARCLQILAPDKRIDVLPNPVQLNSLRVNPVPARKLNLVLFLGWFVPEKGIFDLVDAVALAIRDVPDIQLALGGFRNELAVRARARARGIEDRIELRGWLDRNAVAQALHECTVLVLPSQTEGFGLVLVEAMACGTPIITCPVGGIPEVVQSPRNAIFVSPGDVSGLSAALVDILTKPHLRQSMAKTGPADARRFDVSYIIPRLRAIYDRVLASAHAHRRHMSSRS